MAGLRMAARAEEMHSPLQSALAAAHQAATQWLLNRADRRPRHPTWAHTTGDHAAEPHPEPAPITDPDEVTLDLAGARSADADAARARSASALAANPGKRVRITWRLE